MKNSFLLEKKKQLVGGSVRNGKGDTGGCQKCWKMGALGGMGYLFVNNGGVGRGTGEKVERQDRIEPDQTERNKNTEANVQINKLAAFVLHGRLGGAQ